MVNTLFGMHRLQMWPWIQVLAYRSEATSYQKRLFEKHHFSKRQLLRYPGSLEQVKCSIGSMLDEDINKGATYSSSKRCLMALFI